MPCVFLTQYEDVLRILYYLTVFLSMNGRDFVEATAITIRLEKALVDSVKQAAAQNDRSLSGEVRQAMRTYLQSQGQVGVSDGCQETRTTER